MADSNANIETSQAIALQIILRQTDYSIEDAKAKLVENNNDYMKVIRCYLKQGVPDATLAIKPLSMNQQIYKEIRSFMDEADHSQSKNTTF